MKIGITGLANSGKTTVFNALTGMGVETTVYATTGGEPNMGVVKVPDIRVDKLTEIFNPKKTANSTVQYIDYVGLTKGDMKQNRSVFEFVKDADALVHVVRAFADDAVVHPLSKVDPVGDVSTVETEMLFGDMELVEKRLEGMELSKKKGKKVDEEEKKALLKCKEALESEKPLRDVEFTEQERSAMRHLQFMTMKPEVVAVNISEDDLNTPRAEELKKAVEGFYGEGSSVTVITLSGKIEMDIAEMPVEDRGAFLQDLGIDEPALDRLIRVCYENVGLISFFTVGEDEVKAWAIRRGIDAVNAAGKIHSDIQRGFIRAEVIGYDEFIANNGSMTECKDKGLLRLEGKTYGVRDGDIINFRFNV
jgi:GTP-binding protein YchF